MTGDNDAYQPLHDAHHHRHASRSPSGSPPPVEHVEYTAMQRMEAAGMFTIHNMVPNSLSDGVFRQVLISTAPLDDRMSTLRKPSAWGLP